MSFFESFQATLTSFFPETMASLGDSEALSPYQVSPHLLNLPISLKRQITEAVEAYWSYVHQRPADRPYGIPRRERGVCSSFDFHVRNGQIKLIEVNTNASLSLFFAALEKQHGLQVSFEDFSKPFLKDHDLQLGASTPSIAIVDQDIARQRMRSEFYLYQELFQKMGLESQVLDLSQITWDEQQQKLLSPEGKSFDFVYNRHTDFYFDQPESRELLKAYRSERVTISPNPYNYELMAHKKILCDLTKDLNSGSVSLEPRKVQALKEVLLPTYWAKELSPEDLWKRRKEFFFKPAASFGSKGVYRGKSISRKVFETILAGSYMAQEIFAPGTVSTEAGEMKFDLRAITYGTELLITGARLYTGQVTNFRTLGGGAAAVVWTK